MVGPGVAEHLDPDEVEALCKSLEQGEVLDVAKNTLLFSPDVCMEPAEIEGLHDHEPVMTKESRLESGLSVIISQGCDLERSPEEEPYVVLAPLTSVPDAPYTEAARGRSARLFAFPQIEARPDKDSLVADLRMTYSLEKVALLSDHIERFGCPLSDPQRTAFREFLGARYGRPDLPDDIVREIVNPLAAAIKKLNGNAAHANTLSTVVWVGLRWTPGKPHASVLLLTDPGLREQAKVGDQEISGVRTRLGERMVKAMAKSDYSVTVQLHDTITRPASDLLEHHNITRELGMHESVRPS